MYVDLVVGNKEASDSSLILFFHALLASGVGSMYFSPFLSTDLMQSAIHLLWTSMLVGPLLRRVGPCGP